MKYSANRYLITTSKFYDGTCEVLYLDEEIIIEELNLVPGAFVRRMYYRDNMKIVQSDIIVSNGGINFEITNTEYYVYFYKYIRRFLEAVKMKCARVLILGNGCGILQLGIHDQFGNKKINSTGVELNQKIIDISKQFFFYQENESMRVF